jgi:hypothetical protein
MGSMIKIPFFNVSDEHTLAKCTQKINFSKPSFGFSLLSERPTLRKYNSKP